MQPKIGVAVFAHGTRLPKGNEIMVGFVEQLRQRLDTRLIEACFLELGKPSIPEALKKLARQGCTHIHGYALFLTPGKHLQEDIPFIFEQTLKEHPGVTWTISGPMLENPALLDWVSGQIAATLRTGISNPAS